MADGISCRQHIRHATGKAPKHLIEVVAEKLGLRGRAGKLASPGFLHLAFAFKSEGIRRLCRSRNL